MNSRNWYTDRAVRLLKLSETLRDPGERKKLLEIALGYLALARYVAERRDHGTAHRLPEHQAAQHPDDA